MTNPYLKRFKTCVPALSTYFNIPISYFERAYEDLQQVPYRFPSPYVNDLSDVPFEVADIPQLPITSADIFSLLHRVYQLKRTKELEDYLRKYDPKGYNTFDTSSFVVLRLYDYSAELARNYQEHPLSPVAFTIEAYLRGYLDFLNPSERVSDFVLLHIVAANLLLDSSLQSAEIAQKALHDAFKYFMKTPELDKDTSLLVQLYRGQPYQIFEREHSTESQVTSLLIGAIFNLITTSSSLDSLTKFVQICSNIPISNGFVGLIREFFGSKLLTPDDRN